MAVWPVFLDRAMHEDAGLLFRVGDSISWDVILADGAAEGWPEDRLVETDVRIEARPDFARSGLLARTPGLAACWRGHDPVGSMFQIRAGLSVDLFNPPFRSTVSGLVIGIETARSRMAQDARGVWRPVGPWQLAEVPQTPRWLASRAGNPADGQDLGFLIELDVRSHRVQRFPGRADDPA